MTNSSICSRCSESFRIHGCLNSCKPRTDQRGSCSIQRCFVLHGVRGQEKVRFLMAALHCDQFRGRPSFWWRPFVFCAAICDENWYVLRKSFITWTKKTHLKTSSPLNNSGGGWHAPVLHWLWVSKNIMLFHCAFEVTNTFPDEWCQMSHLPKQNVYNSNVVPQMSQPQKNLNDLKHYIQQSLQTMIHFKIIQVPFLFWSPLEATSIFLASFLKKPAMPPATWTDGCHGLSSSEEWWLLKCESAPMLLPDKPALDIWEAELPAPELPERVEFAWERHQSK